jgi:hypothetical protein
MTLHPHALPPVPDMTAAAVHAAFPHRNVYADLRTEFGTLYDIGSLPICTHRLVARGNPAVARGARVGHAVHRRADRFRSTVVAKALVR